MELVPSGAPYPPVTFNFLESSFIPRLIANFGELWVYTVNNQLRNCDSEQKNFRDENALFVNHVSFGRRESVWKKLLKVVPEPFIS